MAPKRKPHHIPPPSSESKDEEHSTSSIDSDSKPQQLTQSKPQKPQQEYQESEESDSDYDADSSSDDTQKPPSAVSPESNKPALKQTQLKPYGKRPAETDQIDKVMKGKKSKMAVKKVDNGSKSDENVDKGLKSDKGKSVEKGSKKGKMSNGDDSDIEDKKAAFFTRLFTEEDEIVLLEGMIDYKENKRGADPSLSIVEFVESLLSCSVTRSQIVDKIRRLKKKFMNNVRKGKNGEDPVISRPHEFKLFELSKKIWGSEVRGSGDDSRVKSSRKKDNKDDNVGSKTPVGNESDIAEQVMGKTEAEMEDCWSLYPCLCASLESEAIKNFTALMTPKEYVNKVVGGLEKEKVRELEQEWKGLVMMEQQVYAKRANMISKQAEAAMNAIHP